MTRRRVTRDRIWVDAFVLPRENIHADIRAVAAVPSRQIVQVIIRLSAFDRFFGQRILRLVIV
jgi:hypothetical protein